jgi:hypothetical protein
VIKDWFAPHRFRRTVAPPTAKVGCAAIILGVIVLIAIVVIFIHS